MKYVTIQIEPFKLKADIEDEEQTNHDVLEKVAAMVEAETLSWSIVEDEDEEEGE